MNLRISVEKAEKKKIEFIFTFLDIKKSEGKNCICNESLFESYFECTRERNQFQQPNNFIEFVKLCGANTGVFKYQRRRIRPKIRFR